MSNSQVRVRFAPSPTGTLHIGGVRTALYNYLFAKKNGGKMILRIEDTDQNRYVPNAEEYIIDSLAWCGIRFDEDVVKGGDYAPYRQSERRHLYRPYAEQLVAQGHAYYAFDSEQELEVMREGLKNSAAHLTQYGPHTRMKMKNSLTLSKEEVTTKIAAGDPFVIRIRMPENEVIRVNDLIRGEVVVQTDQLDDKVLFKSDGWPTYHLANIVDDHLMEITHVIRGEEWLPSAPLHVLLYRCFGWESTMPNFAHLPLLLKPDGNGKLSKRDGDRLGFPVFPLQWTDPKSGEISSGYRESGYIPEAFINMLAFLGWNPGTEQEIFSMVDLIDHFSLERVGKHGSKYDPEKARWFNHQYVQGMKIEELVRLLRESAVGSRQSADLGEDLDFHEKLEKICNLVKERVVLLPDLWKNSWFFFEAPSEYDAQVKAKIWQQDTGANILAFAEELEGLNPFNKDTLHDFIQDFIARRPMKMGQLMNPLRLLTVGSNQGPGMMDIADVLGKEEFLRRIRIGVEKVENR
ncbi:MAG: glutamate--tRNA ligase [Bacteroidota bacterium]